MRALSLLSVLAGSVLLSGCAGAVRYTYTKPLTSDVVNNSDERTLKHVRGVENVLITRDATGTATLHLFVKENDKYLGMTKAAELGYTRITD